MIFFRLLYEARNKKKPEIPPTTRQDQGTSTRLDTDIIENIPTQNLNTIIPNPLTDNQVSTIYQKDSKHKLKYREVYSTAELRQLIRGEPIYEVNIIYNKKKMLLIMNNFRYSKYLKLSTYHLLW